MVYLEVVLLLIHEAVIRVRVRESLVSYDVHLEEDELSMVRIVKLVPGVLREAVELDHLQASVCNNVTPEDYGTFSGWKFSSM